MKNMIKIFTALFLALTVMPVFAEGPVTNTQKPKTPGISCIGEIKDAKMLHAEWDKSGNCIIKDCVNGWDVDKTNNICKETDEHKTCTKEIGTWLPGIGCSCTYGKKSDGKTCRTKAEKQTETENKSAQKQYDDAIDDIIDAYNSVTKSLIQRCIADGKTLEECKQQ